MMAVLLAVAEFMIVMIAIMLLFIDTVKKPYALGSNLGIKKNWSLALRDPVYVSMWILSLLLVLNIPRLALCSSNSEGDGAYNVGKRYQDGANDAMEYMMLLDLEQKLNGERRNWGEMADVVRARMGIKKDEKAGVKHD